jgi:hypothetical protein
MDVTSVALCFGDRRNCLLDAVSPLSFAIVGRDSVSAPAKKGEPLDDHFSSHIYH